MDKNKAKKIIKYIVNILNMLNFIMLGLTQIWDIPYGNEIAKTIVLFAGAISTYLLSTKAKEHFIKEK